MLCFDQSILFCCLLQTAKEEVDLATGASAVGVKEHAALFV